MTETQQLPLTMLYEAAEDYASTAFELRDAIDGLTVGKQPLAVIRDGNKSVSLSEEAREKIREIVVNALSEQLSETVDRLRKTVGTL